MSPGSGELREGAGEEVVAGRARAPGPYTGQAEGGRGEARAPSIEVVVDERRHVHELDGDAGRDRAARGRLP